jgi:psiF repeat-containing protein
MKSIYVAAGFAFALWALPTHAAEPEKHESQQDRFAHCAHESKGLRAEEHHKFMQECLKSVDGPKEHHQKTAGEPTQQSKMKSCNEEAGRKELHGDERRAFMSSCLKG